MTYRISLDIVSLANNAGTAYVGIGWGLANGIAQFTNTGTKTATVTATGTSVVLCFYFINATASLDNISVREVVFDRSYKAASASITGPLTKAALATGTSLVGYSGFSAANYLREPYSADLDFGTGEWSASAWVNVPSILTLKGNLVNGSAVASSWGFALFGISVLNTGDTITGFGTVSKLRWSAGDGPMGREIGSNQVFSFYVKKAEFKILYVRADQSTSVYPSGFWFDMDTGTVLSNTFPADVITATAAPEVGSGWYRIAVKGSHGSYVKIFVADDTYSVYHGNTTSGYLVCGAQLEVGSVPGPFIPTSGGPTIFNFPLANRAHSSGPAITLNINSALQLAATAFDGTTTRSVTTTATYNTASWLKAEACYTTDGTLSIRVNGREVAATRGAPLLTLNSRYNQILYSEDYSNAQWGKGNCAITSTGQSGPYGANNGTLLTFNSDGGTGLFSSALGLSASAVARAFLVHMKYGSWRWWEITTVVSGVATRSWVDLQNGVAGIFNHTNFTVTLLPTGWVRVYGEFGTVTPSEIYITARLGNGNAATATGNNGATFMVGGVDIRTAALSALPYQRVGAATDFDFAAPLTIGNNFAADAPFPGSIALLKLGATVPTYEQSQFMYEQEKQLFRAGAQSVLPDSGSVVDMAYDDATDRWVAVSATNESYWTGLIRNTVTPVPAGSYTRVTATSGIELVARSTTNPGVDITIPAYGLREELVKRAEAAARLTKELVVYDYVGGFTASTTNGSTAITSVANLTYPASYIGARISGSGIPANTTIVSVSGTTIYLSAPATATATGVSISFLDFELPVGMETKAVSVAGSLKQEGSTKDYTRLYDGFIETVRFAVAPGATAWVQIQAQRITL